MERRTALIAVVISAACFGTLAVLTELAYAEGTTPLPLLTWRFALVSVLMAAYLFVWQPKALMEGARDLPRYAALSLTGYGAASLCFFYALNYTSAPVVAVLLYTYPAIVSVLSAIFGQERFTRARALALVLTFAGCVLVVGVLDATVVVSVPGVALGLGAALGYSVFNLLSYTLVGRQRRLVVMTYTFGISALAMGVVALLAGESLSVTGWSPRLWLLVAAIVLVPTFLAVVLYLRGIRGLGAPQAAIVSTTEPLFTIVLAAIVLPDGRLTPIQLCGAALVVAGVVAAEWPRPRVAEELAAV
jgi:drug/metabolite transporter (DMT)-like permease